MLKVCLEYLRERRRRVDSPPPNLSGVLDAYDQGGHEARAAAVAVMFDSHTLLLATAGQLTVQRDALVKALRIAIEWLDMLSPVGHIPGMAALREALAQAEAPVRVSHGICMECVVSLFPKMAARVAEAVGKAVPLPPGMTHVCCYCGRGIDRRSQVSQ